MKILSNILTYGTLGLFGLFYLYFSDHYGANMDFLTSITAAAIIFWFLGGKYLLMAMGLFAIIEWIRNLGK